MASAAIRKSPVSQPPRGTSRHRDMSANALAVCPNAVPRPSTPQPRPKGGLKLQTSYKQSRVLPDVDDEDSMYPPHRSHARAPENRCPPRLQPSRHGQRPGHGSPLTPTSSKKLDLHSPSSDLACLPERRGSQDHASAGQRRTEMDLQKERDQEAELVARYRVERKVEHTRKERRRSSAESQRSPLSARGDDAWGTSMYDVEVDTRR